MPYIWSMDLYQLVLDQLDARKERRGDFAARLGIDRSTISGWRTSLPKPEMLRAIAQALEIPYARVLLAAMQGTGYVTCPADHLAGQVVHAVDRTEGPSYDRGETEPVAVFSDERVAEEFTAVSNEIFGRFEYTCRPLAIDETPIPSYVQVYTTTWRNSGAVTQDSRRSAQTPGELKGHGVSDIEVSAITDPPGVYELSVDSLDPEAGRETIASALAALGAQGRLLPPQVKVPGVSLSWYMLEATYRANAQTLDQWDEAVTQGLPLEGPGSSRLPKPPPALLFPQRSAVAELLSNPQLREIPYRWGGLGTQRHVDETPQPKRRYFKLPTTPIEQGSDPDETVSKAT